MLLQPTKDIYSLGNLQGVAGIMPLVTSLLLNVVLLDNVRKILHVYSMA